MAWLQTTWHIRDVLCDHLSNVSTVVVLAMVLFTFIHNTHTTFLTNHRMDVFLIARQFDIHKASRSAGALTEMGPILTSMTRMLRFPPDIEPKVLVNTALRLKKWHLRGIEASVTLLGQRLGFIIAASVFNGFVKSKWLRTTFLLACC